jgi:hypothetical protein
LCTKRHKLLLIAIKVLLLFNTETRSGLGPPSSMFCHR